MAAAASSASSAVASAVIRVGARFPAVNVRFWVDPSHSGNVDGEFRTESTEKLFAGKKVILFGVPGAFTPTCSKDHLPSYIKKAKQLRAKGIGEICCVSVNDPYVMRSWGQATEGCQDAGILMLSDGNGAMAKALGLEYDASKGFLGMRMKRFSMLVEDNVVKEINVSEKGLGETGADDLLCKLK